MKKRALIPIYGLALLIAIVLSGLLIVAHPVVWNPMHRAVMEDNYQSRGATGRTLENIFSDAAKVSGGLWTTEPYIEISDSLAYRKMLDKEIHHFEDVRGLIISAKWATAVCLALALIGFIMVGWRKVWNAGLASFILLGIIAGVWVCIHWRSLFRALHWVIFQDDSWILPDACYSLLLFPHRVWQTAGGLIAIYVVIILVAGLILGSMSKSVKN